MKSSADKIRDAIAYNKQMKTRRMMTDPDAIEDREEDMGLKNRLEKPPSVKQDSYEALEEGKEPFKVMDRELMPSQKKAKKKYMKVIRDVEDIHEDDDDKGVVGESVTSEKYVCDICGAKVKVLKGGAGTLVCCDEPMRKLPVSGFVKAGKKNSDVEDYYKELIDDDEEMNKKKGGDKKLSKYYKKLIKLSEGSANSVDVLHDFITQHRKVRERLYDPVASLLIEKETWNRDRATLYILRMVNEAAKLYSKEYGGDWADLFPSKARKVLTDRFVREIEDQRGGGE